MTPIQQTTYDIVKDLQAKCEAEHRYPVCVSMLEISRELNERAKVALNGFITDGSMTWHQNVNGIPMFKILKPKD